MIIIILYRNTHAYTSVPPLTINRVGEVFVSDRLRAYKTIGTKDSGGVVKRGEHDFFFSSLIRFHSTSPPGQGCGGGRTRTI